MDKIVIFYNHLLESSNYKVNVIIDLLVNLQLECYIAAYWKTALYTHTPIILWISIGTFDKIGKNTIYFKYIYISIHSSNYKFIYSVFNQKYMN